MSKVKEMAMTIEDLRAAAAAINDVADWLAAQFSENAEDPATAPTPPIPPEEKKAQLKLEDVRAVLAEKSRAGYTLCGEWCGFCKAKHECRARAEANMLLAQYDFKLPPLLTDSEIEVVLSRADQLVAWASDIKDYALQQAISGKVWNGWKLVEGRSNPI